MRMLNRYSTAHSEINASLTYANLSSMLTCQTCQPVKCMRMLNRYSTAYEVLMPGYDSPTTALVPFAGLLNHTPVSPHVTRFGRVDTDSGCLCFRASQNVTAGEQVYV
jgi:hypothetical protein